MRQRVMRWGSAVALVLLLTACGSKLSQENFNKLSNGMPYADVVKILGEPASTQGGGALGFSATTAVWKDGKNQVTIVFINEKVTTKSMGPVPPAQ